MIVRSERYLSDPAAPVARSWLPSWRRLSHGMAIDAAIEANLLGMRLLTLRAKITALPAVRAPTSVAISKPTPTTLKLHSSNGEASAGSLVDAARFLAEGATHLQAARELSRTLDSDSHIATPKALNRHNSR